MLPGNEFNNIKIPVYGYEDYRFHLYRGREQVRQIRKPLDSTAVSESHSHIENHGIVTSLSKVVVNFFFVF